MCNLQINSKCRRFKKEDNTVKKSICTSMLKLAEKIASEGGCINRIYNKDSIVYDRINNDLFIYKTHGANNIQLRIVYGYKLIGGEDFLYIVDYAVKKRMTKSI